MKSSIFGTDRDVWFMQQALKEARKAYARDRSADYAVLVNAEGAIIARARNYVKKKHTQLAHAETGTIGGCRSKKKLLTNKVF